jgi:hypothetical protein
MAADVATEVALVLDYQFGDRVLPLAQSMPVYVVSSPKNMAAINAVWDDLSQRDGFLLAFGATGFEANQPETEAVIAEQLDHIESVHGFQGGERPYTHLRIYGVGNTPAIQAVLADYGFVKVNETDYGLLAQR